MDISQLQNFYVKEFEARLKYDPSYSTPSTPSLESIKKQASAGGVNFSYPGNLKAAHIGRLFDILEKVQTSELSRLAIARDIFKITSDPFRELDRGFLEEVRRNEIALLSLLTPKLNTPAAPPPLPPSPPQSELSEDEPTAVTTDKKLTWQDFMKKVKGALGKGHQMPVVTKFASVLREKHGMEVQDEFIRSEYAVWLPQFQADEKEKAKEPEKKDEKPQKKKVAEKKPAPEATPPPVTPVPVPAPVEAPVAEEKSKAKIPKKVKEDVWKTYVGEEIAKHKCLCCKMTTIDKASFDCGHVVSEANGGGLEVKNLRPICAGCNHSMGTMNMVDYVKRHGYFIGGGM